MSKRFQEYLDDVMTMGRAVEGKGDVESKKSLIDPSNAKKRLSGDEITPIPAGGEGTHPMSVAKKLSGKATKDLPKILDKQMEDK